jgi:hypothetical protein
MAAPHLAFLLAEHVAQHAAARKRIVQMQLVDPAHQTQILG